MQYNQTLHFTKRPTLLEVEGIAKQAGDILNSYFSRDFKIAQKEGNQGIVTDADFASEHAIIDFISKHFPGHSILAEESGLKGLLGQTGEKTPLWVIDPLDGTTNFSKRNAYHCVSIGFGYVTDGKYQAELGVVYHPVLRDLYSAEQGKGSFFNGKKVEIEELADRGLACIATGFASNKGGNLKQVVDSIFAFQSEFLGVRVNGAAALDLAGVATTRLQGFYEKALSPWDMAAGALIVCEAGGKVTNFAGQDFDCLRDKDVIAAAKNIHSFILQTISKSFQ